MGIEAPSQPFIFFSLQPNSFSPANLKLFDPHALGQFPSLTPFKNTKNPKKKWLYSISYVASS